MAWVVVAIVPRPLVASAAVAHDFRPKLGVGLVSSTADGGCGRAVAVIAPDKLLALVFFSRNADVTLTVVLNPKAFDRPATTNVDIGPWANQGPVQAELGLRMR